MITTKTPRQTRLDGLRGLAAVLVVTTHHLSAFHPYAVFGDRAGHGLPAFAWERLFFMPPLGLLTAGHFAVCLFFILSGYVLAMGHLGKGQDRFAILGAMLKRPVRLGGLVLFTVMLGAIAWSQGLYANQAAARWLPSMAWFGLFWPGGFDAPLFWRHVLTAPFASAGIYNPPLWTIKIELYGSVYVYLFLLVLGRFRFSWLAILLLLVYLRHGPYFGFFVGLALADLKQRGWLAGQSRTPAVLSVILMLGAFCLVSYPGYVSPAFLQGTLYGALPPRAPMFVGYPMLAACMAFAALLMHEPMGRWLSRPFWALLGRISYALYALHFLVLGTFTAWLFCCLLAFFNPATASALAIIAGFAMTMLLAHGVTLLVDQPVTRAANVIEAAVVSRRFRAFAGQVIGRLRRS
jgi:peptidoglycan/LPS O-acetylase OafA/YrhL